MALERVTKRLFSSLAIGLSALILSNCEESTKLIKIYEPPKPIPIKRCIDFDKDSFYSQKGCGTYVDCNDEDPTKWQAQTFYQDKDNDGFGSNKIETFCAGWTPKGYSRNNQDCNDNDSNINPNKYDLCNKIDDDCNPETPDGSSELVLNSKQEGVCKHSQQKCIDGSFKEDYSNIPNYQEQETACENNGLDRDCDGFIDDRCSSIALSYIVKTATGTNTENISSIKIIDIDGLNKVQVVSSKTTKYSDPTFSPDGKSIVYSESLHHPNDTILKLHYLERGIAIPMSNEDALEADWCNTGLILFRRNYEIWSVDPLIGIGSETQITLPEEKLRYRSLNYNPNCSFNGQKIIHIHAINSTNFKPSDTHLLNNQGHLDFYIRIIDIDAENPKILDENWPVNNSYFNQAVWFPNSEQLIFSLEFGNGSGNHELLLGNEFSSFNTLDRLTNDPNYSHPKLPESGTYDDINPCISKDERYLVFTSRRTGSNQVYVMQFPERKTTQLTNINGDVQNIDCR